VLCRGGALGVDLGRAGWIEREDADAEPSWVIADLGQVRPGRRRSGVGVSWHRTGDAIQDRSGVADASGDDVLADETPHGVAELGA